MAPASTCQAAILARSGEPVDRIVLEVPSGYRFEAGQYVEVHHPDGPIPLSIASAPWRLPELHLHYRSTPGVPEAARMDELLARGEPLTLGPPGGDVALPEPLPGPALLVAGGTGMAQAWSLLDALSQHPPVHRVTLLWCADHEDDLYLRRDIESLSGSWLRAVLIADQRRDANNQAMAWLRAHGMEASGGARRPGPVILCGGPPFVYAACDALEAAGIEAGRLQSDVFSYAPRPSG